MEETTIDRLVLQLGLDSEEFKQQLKNISKGLEKLQKQFIDAANANDNFNKKKKNSDSKADAEQRKREREAEKLRKKRAKERKDMLNDLDNALKKIFVIGGISFGVKSLNGNAEKSTKNVTNLVNDTRNYNFSTKQLDAINTTLKKMGLQENSLTPVLQAYSRNQAAFKTGFVAPDEEITSQLVKLNNFDANIDYINDDSITILKKMHKLFSKMNQDQRVAVASFAKIDPAVFALVTHPDFLKFYSESLNQSTQNSEKNKKATNLNAKNEKAQKDLDNAVEDLGLTWMPTLIKLKELSAMISSAANFVLNEFNNFQSQWENQVKKYVPALLDKSVKEINEVEKAKQHYIDELSKNIERVDKKNRVIYYKSGESETYEDINSYKSLLRSPYLTKFLNSLFEDDSIAANNSTISASQVRALQYQNYSNAISQNININELNVTSNANNVREIINDASQQTKFFSTDASSMLPYINNVR